MEPIKTIVSKLASNLTTPKASEETMEKGCADCTQSFTVPRWGLGSYEIRCEPCRTAKNVALKAAEAETLQRSWETVCPKQFQSTIPDKLPCQRAVARALAWKPSERGLILNGPTRAGKSRTAWLVLKECHFGSTSFAVMDSMSGLRYAAKFSESAASVEKWAESVISVGVLFMDDVFKTKLTDSYEGVIFSIIDQRTQAGRPIILTANDTGESLARRMTQDRGEPLVARLREFCETITFKLD